MSSLSATLPVSDKVFSPRTGRWIHSHRVLTSHERFCKRVFWQHRVPRGQPCRRRCRALTFCTPQSEIFPLGKKREGSPKDLPLLSRREGVKPGSRSQLLRASHRRSAPGLTLASETAFIPACAGGAVLLPASGSERAAPRRGLCPGTSGFPGIPSGMCPSLQTAPARSPSHAEAQMNPTRPPRQGLSCASFAPA